MTTNSSSPQRLYLMQVAMMTMGPRSAPVPCYLVQTQDGKNILIDTGVPINFLQLPANSPLAQMTIQHTGSVVEQLAMLAIKPSDIDILISTHFDADHAGNHGAFSGAQFVVQRLHHEVASSGHPRFALTRSQWDQPASRYQLVDGDFQLLPGLDLIETSGHVPGHQAILIDLPKTGPVLLAIDAITHQMYFKADRQGTPMDADAEGAIASTRKLLDIVEKKHPTLVVFGHDAGQWATLKKLPEYYD